MSNNVELLARAQELIDLAKVPIKRDLSKSTAHRYFDAVADAVRALGPNHLPHWAKEWAPEFRKMVDNYDRECERDPAIQYTPAHFAAERYHRSKARRLYAKCANAVGKTSMGFMEDYRILTHQDPHRKYEEISTPNMALASLEHTTYGLAVFEAKLINGETNNFLSPMFPDGGKWLHKYDKKTRTIWIKCPKCANDTRGPMCKEPVFFRHFSAEGGWEGFQGATYAAVHIDEHIPEDFYDEAEIRVERSDLIGRIFVTGTPLFGRNAWEIKRLQGYLKSTPPELNRITLNTGESVPMVEMIRITQAEAGFKTAEQIEQARLRMSKSKFKARYLGEEVPDVKNAVFEDDLLEEQETFNAEPKYGQLDLYPFAAAADGTEYPVLQDQYDPHPGELIDDEALTKSDHLRWHETGAGNDPETWTGYRIWKMPEPGQQYIMGVDIAAGLSQETHDASCCQVFRIYMDHNYNIALEQVAQFYGWVNPHVLGVKVKRLGVFYNTAKAVVEITGGLGQAHILALKQLAYPAIFRNTRDPAHKGNEQDPRLGVDTNIKTKPMFIASCVQLMREGRLFIRDKETIFEMRSFIQKTTEAGNVKYEAAESAHDDRVTSALFPCFTTVHFPMGIYDAEVDLNEENARLSNADRAKLAIQAASSAWDTGTNYKTWEPQ